MRRLRAIDLPPALGAIAVLVVLLVGSDTWSDVGWATAASSALAIVCGLLVPVVTVVCRSPSLPVAWTVVTLLSALAAVVALLIDGVLVGALAAAVETVAAYYAMKDDRTPGIAGAPVDVRPAPPAA